MIDFSPLFEVLPGTSLECWGRSLPSQLDEQIHRSNNGNWPRWLKALDSLPAVVPNFVDYDSSRIVVGRAEDCDNASHKKIEQSLRQLCPWRKGPYSIFGIDIDTEWRSDWKWDRLKDVIQPLKGRWVLDVGCGNGYHCWRMAGAGAKQVIGIDPSLLFLAQFYSVRRYVAQAPVHMLPLALEALPSNLQFFDTVFSMGVLYHRRSPFEHLMALKGCLRDGGELVLETLVVEGGLGEVLVPEGRYAKMRNVWFLPSCPTMTSWLKRCGFKDIRVVSINQTTVEEQRKTDWMAFESLKNFLDPCNPDLTVEGLPAPKRAIFLAVNP